MDMTQSIDLAATPGHLIRRAQQIAVAAVERGGLGGRPLANSPANSVVGDYKIDFDALDANRNGTLSRGEVRSNATLSAEFRAVDVNRDGRLSKDELKGWM